MTAREIFNRAVILMFGEEIDKADYEPFFIETLNVLLGDTFFENNALRQMRGKEPLPTIPVITSMEDVVPYEDIFTNILVYGTAGYIYTDDDKGLGAEYKNKYEYERSRVLTSCDEDIIDVYK